jgi:hypothetical protein
MCVREVLRRSKDEEPGETAYSSPVSWRVQPVCARGVVAERNRTRDLEFEKAYNGAYAAKDLPKYFSCLASDFTQLLPLGRTDKDSYQKS